MAAAAARCLRAMPTARSLIVVSRSSMPAKVTPAASLLPRSTRPFDPFVVDPLTSRAGGDGSLAAALPTMEVVNRNARKPKKANHGKRPCSHVGRRQRRRRKNLIRNGP